MILDVDGTVCLGDELVPGAREAITWLAGGGYPLVYLSNMVDSPEELAARLEGLGLPASPDRIVTVSRLTRDYLRRYCPGATVFVLGDVPLIRELAADFLISEDPQAIEVVVASADPAFDYRRLTIAFHALRRGARFLATNTDPTWPTPEGEAPDAGAVIGALEGCTGRKVELVLGKPSPLMAQAALECLGLPAHQTWIVGDNMESDIRMGKAAGMTTVLVRTGVARQSPAGQGPVEPDHVLDSLADLPALLRRHV